MSTANGQTAQLSNQAQSLINAYNTQESDEGGEEVVEDSDVGGDAVDDTAFDGEAQVDDSGVVDAQATQTEEPSPQETPASAKAAADGKAEKPASGDVEETFEVEDASGIKRQVAVKFDAKTRKKLVHAAAQRQRFQSERDRALAQVTEAKPKLDAYDKLNEAWTSSADPVDRVRALVAQLGGGEEAFEAAVQKEADLRAWLAKAQPHEKTAYEADRARKKAEATLASERKKLDAERKAAADKAEAAENAQAESAVHAAFDSLRFSGKLKDEVLADRLDRQVFAAASGTIKEAIENAKAKGAPLTPAQVNAMAKSAFKEHFSALRGLVKEQVKAGTAAAIDTAKTNAAHKASSIAAGEVKQGGGTQAKAGSRTSMKNAILASMRAKG